MYIHRYFQYFHPSQTVTSDGRLVDENGDRLDLLPPVDPVQVVDLETLKTLREDASQGCHFSQQY